MKTSRYVLGALLAATLGLGVGFAQNTPPAAGGGGGAAGGGGGGRGGAGGGGFGGGGGGGGFMARNSQNPYDDMVKTLTTLTDDQKALLKTKTDAMVQALADQQTALRDAQTAVRTAMTSGDGLVAAATVLQKLQTDQAALAAKSEMDVESVLTADQKVDWESHKLSVQVDARLRSLTLTADQKTKVDASVKDTAKALAAVTDGLLKPAIIGKFWKKLVAEILTDAQATTLMVPPAGGGGMFGTGGFGGGGGGFGGGGGGFGGGGGAGGGGAGPAGAGGGGGRGGAGMGGGGAGGGGGGRGGAGGGGGGRGGAGAGGAGAGGGAAGGARSGPPPAN